MQNVRSCNFHLHKARIMAPSADLPDHFEVVVMGTGMVESIVAAAAARAGHTVLHIDTADHYGGDWASFNLSGLQKWIEKHKTQHQVKNEDSPDCEESQTVPELEESERFLTLDQRETVEDIVETWHSPPGKGDNSDKSPDSSTPHENGTASENSGKKDSCEASDTTGADAAGSPAASANPATAPAVSATPASNDEWNKEKLLALSTRFNIDLSPRLLYARGDMVELLISSNISRYTEFKSATRVLTLLNGQLEHVPSSRADVFGTKHISVVEKRILMKFLSSCLADQENPDHFNQQIKAKPKFKDFLKAEKLTDNLIHFVVHAIAMVSPDTETEVGLKETRKFLSSLGRFGNTPFLWSMYGSGELPQAFCRLCAVFGGIYYLGRNLQNIIVKDTKCVGVVTGGKRISCDRLVLPDANLPEVLRNGSLKQVRIRRSIHVSTESLMPSEKEQLTFLSIPPSSSSTCPPVHVVEVSAGTGACPKGLHVVQASYPAAEDEVEAEMTELTSLLNPSHLLYSLAFTQTTNTGEIKTTLENVYRASGPSPELDFDNCVAEARSLYEAMYPGEEFLPRAPDPEEIILGGEEGEEEGDKGEELGDKGEEQGEKEEGAGDRKIEGEKERDKMENTEKEEDRKLDGNEEMVKEDGNNVGVEEKTEI